MEFGRINKLERINIPYDRARSIQTFSTDNLENKISATPLVESPFA